MTHATISDDTSSSSSIMQWSESDAVPQNRIPKCQPTESKPQHSDGFYFEVEDEEDNEGNNEIGPQAKRPRPEEECTSSQGEELLMYLCSRFSLLK